MKETDILAYTEAISLTSCGKVEEVGVRKSDFQRNLKNSKYLAEVSSAELHLVGGI